MVASRLLGSLPHSRFLDVTQRSPYTFGGALRDIQKTAARETNFFVVIRWWRDGRKRVHHTQL